MPAETSFRLIVQTPRSQIFAGLVTSLRVPTETGQVGLHLRHEGTVLAIEPGLVLAHDEAKWHFLGTSGGILSSDGALARLLTPLAVIGNSAPDVVSALERALAAPDADIQARAKLGQLEANIVNQLRQPARPGTAVTRA